ncbi:MAG: hypothetical protein ABEJ70_00700 [Halobacteriaceae archaeon]
MATCPSCGADHPASELVRHEGETYVVVHCPDCRRRLGGWRKR